MRPFPKRPQKQKRQEGRVREPIAMRSWPQKQNVPIGQGIMQKFKRPLFRPPVRHPKKSRRTDDEGKRKSRRRQKMKRTAALPSAKRHGKSHRRREMPQAGEKIGQGQAVWKGAACFKTYLRANLNWPHEPRTSHRVGRSYRTFALMARGCGIPTPLARNTRRRAQTKAPDRYGHWLPRTLSAFSNSANRESHPLARHANPNAFQRLSLNRRPRIRSQRGLG